MATRFFVESRPELRLHAPMKTTLSLCLGLTLVCGLSYRTAAAEPAKPLRALLICGGCCHDYNQQKVIIPEGVRARANVTWTVVQEGGTGTRHDKVQESIYQNPAWASGFDVVVH